MSVYICVYIQMYLYLNNKKIQLLMLEEPCKMYFLKHDMEELL